MASAWTRGETRIIRISGPQNGTAQVFAKDAPILLTVVVLPQTLRKATKRSRMVPDPDDPTVASVFADFFTFIEEVEAVPK
jgi:hypothetical protein